MSKIKCCDKGRSIYNYDGLPAQYCTTHRLDGMVNVVAKRCAHEGGVEVQTRVSTSMG